MEAVVVSFSVITRHVAAGKPRDTWYRKDYEDNSLRRNDAVYFSRNLPMMQGNVPYQSEDCGSRCSPKSRYISTRLQGITFHKTVTLVTSSTLQDKDITCEPQIRSSSALHITTVSSKLCVSFSIKYGACLPKSRFWYQFPQMLM